MESFQDDIRTIIQQEREERALRIAEMEARKAKNLIEFEDEIKARPARTWFQSERCVPACLSVIASARPHRSGRPALSGVNREKKEARERMKKREAGKEGEEAGEGEAGAENAKDRKARLWREKQEAKRGEKEVRSLDRGPLSSPPALRPLPWPAALAHCPCPLSSATAPGNRV